MANTINSGIQQALVSPYLRSDQSAQSGNSGQSSSNKLTRLSSENTGSTQHGHSQKTGRGKLVDISV